MIRLKNENTSMSGYTISRIVSGEKIEIELTDSEVYGAYEYQEHNFYVADIEKKIEEIYTGGKSACEIKANKNLMAEIVSAYKANRDKGMEWDDAADDAVKNILQHEERA